MDGGKKFKSAREAKKLSALDLAEKLDVSQPTIWRIENDGHIPAKDLMKKIVDFFDGEITPNDFYGIPPTQADEAREAAQ